MRSGGHRLNRNFDGDTDGDGAPDDDENEDNGPAAVIFDNWYETLVHLIFDDELGPVGFELLPTPVTDRDQWHDMSSYIDNLFNRRARDAYARNYCDDMTTAGTRESCDALVVKAFDQVVDFLTRDQGEDMTQWTTPAWFNEFSGLGLGSVRKMPWQNRGTHNHVVEIMRKANDGPTEQGVSPTPSPSGT